MYKTATALCALFWGLMNPACAGWWEDLEEAGIGKERLQHFKQAIPSSSLNFPHLMRLVTESVDLRQKLTSEKERRRADLVAHLRQSQDPNGIESLRGLEGEFSFKILKADAGYRALAREWIPQDMPDEMLAGIYDHLENSILFQWLSINLERVHRGDFSQDPKKSNGLGSVVRNYNPKKESLKNFSMDMGEFLSICGVFKIPPELNGLSVLVWGDLKIMERVYQTWANDLFSGRPPRDKRELKTQLIREFRALSDVYAPGTYKVWQQIKPLEADDVLYNQVLDRMKVLRDDREMGRDGSPHYGRLLRLWWSHERGHKPTADEKVQITSYDALMFPHQAKRALEILESYFKLSTREPERYKEAPWRLMYEGVRKTLWTEFEMLWMGSRPTHLESPMNGAPEDEEALQTHASMGGDEASAYAQTKAMDAIASLNSVDERMDLPLVIREKMRKSLEKKALFWWKKRPAEVSFGAPDEETNRRLQTESEMNFFQFVESLQRDAQITSVVLWDRPRLSLMLQDLENLWKKGQEEEARSRVMAVAARPDWDFMAPLYGCLKKTRTMAHMAMGYWIGMLGENTDVAVMEGPRGVFQSQSQLAQDLLIFMGPLPAHAWGTLDQAKEAELLKLYNKPGSKDAYDRAVFQEAVGHIYDAYDFGKSFLASIEDPDTHAEEAVVLGFWALESPETNAVFDAMKASLFQAAGAWKMRFGDVFGTASPEFETIQELMLKHQGWANFRTFVAETLRTLGMEPWTKENFLDFFSMEKAEPREAPFSLKKAVEAWTHHTVLHVGI